MMIEDGSLPEIKPVIQDFEDEVFCSLKKRMIYKILQRCVPLDFFREKTLEERLPVTQINISSTVPGTVSVNVFGFHQKHALKFIIEMLSSWLIPGKRLNIASVFSAEFCLENIDSNIFMAAEVTIQIDTQEEFEKIQANLSFIESELQLGIKSWFYAERVLQVKGLSSDAKTSMVQEYMAHLMERSPSIFEHDLLTEMQHVLIMCRDDYKKQRSSKHLARIIAIQYIFRKKLSKQAQSKRELLIKVFRREIHQQNQKKPVLGIIVGINFLREKEIFERRHLMHTIQNHIPDAVIVENSFLDNKRSIEQSCTLYLEIEKSSGKKFTGDEINLLRSTLTKDLLDSIEELVHPVFMPRNEEEIMRSILRLSEEVKFIRDLPQVIIQFDEQTYSSLKFTVIVVRVLKPGDDTIKDLFENSDTSFEYVHDRCKMVGYLRSKYIKEVTVFCLKTNKDEFIRRDHSIDLNKARQAVVFELLKIIGEFRDFNGGMISKQNELLMDVRELVEKRTKVNDLLLENFFFSISPIVMRTVLEPMALKLLFILLLETIEMKISLNDGFVVHESLHPSFTCVVVKSDRKLKKEELAKGITELGATPSELASTYVKVHDIHYNGFVLRSTDLKKQELFCSLIKRDLVFQ